MTKFRLALALALLSACDATYRDVDGADFLRARPNAQIDPEIAAAATPEIRAQLAFPARIGTARIVYGDTTLPPNAEAGLWTDLAQRHAGIGTFTPLHSTVGRTNDLALRQAAAALSLDYIVITELDIAQGTATARFVDVRNGYLYATTSASSRLGGHNGFWGNEVNNPGRRARLSSALATELLPEVDDMLSGLALRQNR